MDPLVILSTHDLKQLIKEVVLLTTEELNKSHNGIFLPHSEDQILCSKEVLLLLKISKPTLFKKMKDGTIPYTRIGRRLLFKKNEVLDSLKRRN